MVTSFESLAYNQIQALVLTGGHVSNDRQLVCRNIAHLSSEDEIAGQNALFV